MSQNIYNQQKAASSAIVSLAFESVHLRCISQAVFGKTISEQPNFSAIKTCDRLTPEVQCWAVSPMSKIVEKLKH